MAKNGKLTGKQAKFVQEYLIDMNATQAAIRAGYSSRSAHYMGFDTLRNPKVQEALAIARQELSVKTGITPEKVVQGLADIAFSDIADCYDKNGHLRPIHEIPLPARHAVAGLDVDQLYEVFGADKKNIGQTKKIKRWDKVRALESLMKYFGLFESDNRQKDNPLRLVLDKQK